MVRFQYGTITFCNGRAVGAVRHCSRGAGVSLVDYVLTYDHRTYRLVSRDLYDAERAARAREEARALALEAELERVRAEAETVRVAYEQAHLALQARIVELRTRCGGEMLRADEAVENDAISKCLARMLLHRADEVARERDEARAEIERLRAVVAQLQAVPLSEEGDGND